MRRTLALLQVSLCTTSLILCSQASKAASPRQSALNGTITDSSIAFGGGPAAGLNSSAPAGTNGVLLDFDTDITGGASDQVAFEWATFGANLSNFSDFSLNVNPSAGVGGAQLFVRSDDPNNPGNGDFVSSGFNGLTTGVDNKVTIDLSGVAFPNNIVGFGIQLFTNGASAAGATTTLSSAATVSTTEDVLFSWETGLEGWTEGFQPEHTHSLVSTGATHGVQALQIQRENLLGSSFQWGSQRTYDIDPDQDMVADPVVVAEIADLGQRINAADSIAFDVTFNDPIDLVDGGLGGDPGFAGFHLNISDENSFYQATGQFFNPVAPATPETHTYLVSLDTMLGQGGVAAGLPLTDLGFKGDSPAAAFTIATNTDGAGLYQIDNFRLIAEEVISSADFDLDSDVDADDLAILRAAYGVNNDGDADFDGDTDGQDLLIWQQQFAGIAALSAASSVPEPSSVLLIAFGGLFVASSRRRAVA